MGDELCRGVVRPPGGFADYDFENEALPEASLAAVDLSASIAGKPLRAPLMIAPMTGGTPRGRELNRRLAAVAEEFGLAFGVGSQRIALENPECAEFFRVRDVAPTVPLFANFGAAQLARGYGADEARRAVAMIGADALFVHLNPLQEAVKAGDRDFRADSQTKLERLRHCRIGDQPALRADQFEPGALAYIIAHDNLVPVGELLARQSSVPVEVITDQNLLTEYRHGNSGVFGSLAWLWPLNPGASLK